MRFDGQLLSVDGSKVIHQSVTGELTEIQLPGGIRAIKGTFRLGEGQRLSAGDYRLTLNDGKSARVLVTDVHSGTGKPTLVMFHVNEEFT
jgi:MinD-like ATPase involved in chromosome partitioning or flagellar assembly